MLALYLHLIMIRSLFYVFAAIFCDIVDNLKEACFENNILQLWNYEENVIANLTDQDIINEINAANKSSLTLVKYSNLLGNVSQLQV